MDNHAESDEGDVYPIAAVVQIGSDMLAMMHRVIRGETVDDALYGKVFGHKEGLVQQLQRLCDVLADARALEVQQKAPQRDARVMDEEERALIRHYVVQMAQHYAVEQASAGDALPE